MKQTAIQELILEFQELKKTKLYQTSFKAIDDCIDLAITKLELEKEQIEDAFCEGADDEYEHHINGDTRKNSEQYYDETYKNERGN